MRGFIDQQYGQHWGPFAAGVLIAAVPAVILFQFLQRYIVVGAHAGRGQGMSLTLLNEPHHDGSDACVPERPDELGGEAVVRLRVPRGAAASAVCLRYVENGEPRGVEAVVDEETETEVWWRATSTGLEPVRALPLAGRGPERLHLAERDRACRPRSSRRRRLRPLARPGRARLAPGLRGVRDLPRPLRGERHRVRPARLGRPARMGRAADRARPRHPARVVRRRPRRDRGSASTTSSGSAPPSST